MGDGEDQVVVADLGAGQPGGVGGAVDEGDVQLGVSGGAGEDRGGVVAELDGDAGVARRAAGSRARPAWVRVTWRLALTVLGFVLHILFSPWLLVAVAIVAWIKFRPSRSRQ